jgi:hypothetical protein
LIYLRKFLKRSGKSRGRLPIKPLTGRGFFILIFEHGHAKQLHARNPWLIKLPIVAVGVTIMILLLPRLLSGRQLVSVGNWASQQLADGV